MSDPTDHWPGRPPGSTRRSGTSAPPGDASSGGLAEDFTRARACKRELLAELRASWETGQPVRPEDLLKHWPDDPDADPDVAHLLLEDYLQKARREETSVANLFSERYPQHRESVEGLVRYHELLRSLGVEPGGSAGLRLPEKGDRLFGFCLRQELGRGAFARVFLAEQTDLAGRPVVLKVSAIEGSEPQTLAQLQHTHIVPVFSVHEDERAGLRALCMPYFGGASLSQVLEDLWQNNLRPARGQELVDALRRVSEPLQIANCKVQMEKTEEGEAPPVAPSAPCTPHSALSPETPQATLARLGYVQAVAWVGVRLAEGLQHAHARGILHRDLKPSNILLGADGQPMLLDFNLAHDTQNRQVQASLGGTAAYMAPEHLRAMASRDPALAARVDHRSDIYSLGMVIFEMLVGRRPFDESASYGPLPVVIESMAVERARSAPSARSARPDVPWGLESILRRCLAPDPEARYQRAEELAEDLRRLLADQPLRYAPELSRVEQLRKWARRHPRLTSSGAVSTAAAAVLVAVGVALAGARARLTWTGEQLANARAQDRQRAVEEGAVRALFLVNTTQELSDHQRQGLKVCEETLALYEALEREDWYDHPDLARLTASGRLRALEDTRELLLLLAGGQVRLAPGNRGTLGRALALLDRAERIPGLPPCRALWEDRAAFHQALGDRSAARAARTQAQDIQPASARDHYLLALSHARAQRYRQALRHLDEAIRRYPRHYWSWVQRGLCHLERREYALAAADFGACIGLRPDFAWGYFNRATALAHCGKKAEAIADYTRALDRDPDLLVARVNRGLLRLELERYRPALEDLDAAARQGRDDAFLHSGRAVALERLGRHREADEAFGLARQRARSASREVRHRLWWVEGFAIALRKPATARSWFERTLKEVPTNPQAWYGLGLLLEREDRPDEALRCYDRALSCFASFLQARRARAVLLARVGDARTAGTEINWCLEQEPRGGATLYAAACIAALVVRESKPLAARQAKDQAFDFLRQAFVQGYGQDKMDTDRDLDGIRDDPRFARLRSQDSGTSEDPLPP